jgi:Pyrimidine 5'-nucleotidase (UMPH-1)
MSVLVVFILCTKLCDRHVINLLPLSFGVSLFIQGIAAKEVLSIAFLNDRVDERFADYIATFDVVIIGESAGLHYVNELLSELQ